MGWKGRTGKGRVKNQGNTGAVKGGVVGKEREEIHFRKATLLMEIK